MLMSYSKWGVNGSSFMYQFLNKIGTSYDAYFLLRLPQFMESKRSGAGQNFFWKICILPAMLVIRYEMDATDLVNETTAEATFGSRSIDD